MSKDVGNAEPLSIKIDPTLPVNNKRDDIQLLRAFSIVCVILYHLNSKWLPLGYLGVDIFFVISGFLMAFIIVTPKNTKMTLNLAVDFYYRRIKRIFPTYLIVIILILVFAAFLLYPLDKYSLAGEAKYSLLFLLNLQPIWTKVEYFQLLTLYKFTAHLWSLCVEIQFYLIVPFIFFLFFHMNQVLRVIFCIIVIMASFASQLLLPDLYKHAFTPARFWQFFCGILAFYLQIRDWNVKVNKIVRFGSLPLILVGLTCLMFTRSEIIPTQIARLCCTLLAALILWLGNLLEFKIHKSILFIGDHSYTIYLVHWPLIVYYKYLRAEEQISFFMAIILTIATLVITFIIDISIEFTFKQMNSKTSIMSIVVFLYILAVALNYEILKTGKSHFHITDSEKVEIRSIIDDFYGNQSLSLSDEQAYRYNSFLLPYDSKLRMCLDSRPLNESMPETVLKQYICRIRQPNPINGKNILVIGNSHAKSAFAGIAYHFSDLFNRLELFAFQRCQPMYTSPRRPGQAVGECGMFIEEMHRVIRRMKWDIIFIIYKFPGADIPFNDKQDTILDGMNQLYRLAAKNTNEVVFVPDIQIKPPFSPLDLAMNRLRVGKKVDNIFMGKNAIVKTMPGHRQRAKLAGCRKCVKVKWTEAKFCDKISCQFVNPTSKLSYFVDDSHVSSLGSYYYGELLRQKYDNYMGNYNSNLNDKQQISFSYLNNSK